MRRKEDYQHFQDHIFQQMQTMTDIEAQLASDVKSALDTLRDLYGFTDQEMIDLYRPGMNGQKYLEILKAARKK
jgi:hypothetical protein